MKKRILSLIMLVTTLILLCSVGVFAEADRPQIISFDTEKYSLESIDALAEEYGLTYILNGFYSGDLDNANALACHPMVLSVEPAGIATLCESSPSSFYKDPLAAEQWALGAIHIEKCWKKYTTGSKDVVVCVIDSGFWAEHPDAQKNFVIGKNYVEEEELNKNNDDTSHGTSVAGIIGATSDNGIGISGLLKDVTVVSQKAFYWDDKQRKKIATEDDIAAAIRDAVDIYGADVINMSFLFAKDYQLIREACEYAESKGAVLVAAAGNNGCAGSDYLYPASYPTVIGVGAVEQKQDGSLVVADISAKNESVYCCAPGINIRTFKNPHSKEDTDTSEYRFAGGTSLAAPHVAGLAALGFSYDPDMKPADFRSLLKDSCTDLGASGYDTSYGYGLIHFEKFFRLMDGNIFDDVEKGIWYHDAVVDVYQRNLMIGIGDSLFGPEIDLTRGMFITLLHRLEGSPDSSATVPFTDVQKGSYYEKAVLWAYENDISEGISSTEYAPNKGISREEVVTMLYRYYTNYKQQTFEDKEGNSVFIDAENIASWAEDAVMTMAKSKLVEGAPIVDSSGKISYAFMPKKVNSRAEAASLISRLQ